MPPANAILMKTRFQFRNGLRMAVRQSHFKQAFILCFAAFFEIVLFLVFRDAFHFLNAFGGAGLLLIGRLFSLFFLGIGVMLTVSSLVTAYSTLFDADEIPFLLTRPFSMSGIVLYKSAQAGVFSSWAFFCVVLPFIGAYAWHQRISPLFVVWTLLFSIPFLFLFTGIGTLMVLIVVRWVPRPSKGRAITFSLTAVAAMAALPLTGGLSQLPSDTYFNIAGLVPGLRIAGHPLSPSFWIAEGITALTRGSFARGALFFTALTTSAALIALILEQAGRFWFYNAWQRSISAVRTRRRVISMPFLRILGNILPSDMAAIIAKDIRIFFRDPVQWSQAVVFFGLLALYFSNLRMFNYNTMPEQWRSTMTFLNVFAVAAVLSSLGSRFVYPQLSLEGHSFWILGLSPATLPRILAAKFLSAVVAMPAISVSLIAVSVRMLGTGTALNTAAIGVITAVSVAVCGLSTGLGAIFMDLRERNPAAIVSGFGGTLNIVLCLTYMLGAILPFGTIFHLHEIDVIDSRRFTTGLQIASLWLFLITIAATVIPLWIGLHTLRNRDY